MSEIKRLGILRKHIVEILERDLPLAVIFDKYELTYEQIDFLYDFTKSIYKDDDEDNIEKDNSFIISSSREYESMNIKFLFLELEKFKTEKLTDKENKIKEEIIIRFIPIIKDTINLFFHNIELPMEDTVMFGINGLLFAIDNYKLNDDYAFNKFAIQNIITSIKNNFKLLKGISFNEYITKENKENILVDTIVPLEKMPTTFDDYEQIDLYEDENLGVFGSKYETEKNQDNKEMKQLIDYSIEKYISSPRGRDIIKKYFSLDEEEGKNFDELAKEYGISKTRFNASLYKLRRSWELKKIYLEFYIQKNYEIDVYSKILSLLLCQISSESIFIFLRMNGIELSKKELELILNKIDKVCDIASTNSFDVSKTLSQVNYFGFIYNNDFSNRKDLIKIICSNYSTIKSSIYNFMHIDSVREIEKGKKYRI